MGRYSGTAGRPDKAKAFAAVLLVHAGLAAVLLAGLNVQTVSRAVERMQAFDVFELPPPPPPPPLEPPEPTAPAPAARSAEGAAGKKATPVVAPEPVLVVPARSPVVAAPIAGLGSAATVGQSNMGAGPGAGRTGAGPGGGGSGGLGSGNAGRGFTPAQKITKIPDGEYRRIKALGPRRGSLSLTVKVEPNGVPSNCRIGRSSGYPAVDALMCQLTLQYVRFRPARDPAGQPVAQDIRWTPDWSPR